MRSKGTAFFMAKRKLPQQPIFKMKPFKTGRIKVKLGKLPSFRTKKIKV